MTTNRVRFYAEIKNSFACLPYHKISNFELAENFSSQTQSLAEIAQKIEKHSGIRERRYAQSHEAASSLAIKSVLYNSIKKSEIHSLIIATTSGDYPSPATASFVHKELNLKKSTHCLDVASSCSSFLSALIASQGFLSTNSNAMIIASEVKHKALDNTDIRTKSLFSDGAGGIFLHYGKRADFFYVAFVEINSTLSSHILIPVGGSKNPINEFNYKKNKLEFLEPKMLFIHTVKQITAAIKKCWIEKNKIKTKKKQCTLIFIHQANKNIICEVKKRLPKKISSCIPTLMSDVGNMVCASLPVLRTRILFIRSLCYFKKSIIPKENLILEFKNLCKTTSEFSYKKKGTGLLFFAKWENEKIHIFDDGCNSLEDSWLARICEKEYYELTKIIYNELKLKTNNKKIMFTDIWIAAGGGFQTIGVIHGKASH